MDDDGQWSDAQRPHDTGGLWTQPRCSEGFCCLLNRWHIAQKLNCIFVHAVLKSQ